MKFLLDENLSRNQSARLRDLGHDAVAVVEVGLSGEPDERVREYSIETARVLVTLGAGGDPIEGPPAGREAIWRQIERTVFALLETEMAGRLAVSSGDAIRIQFAGGTGAMNS